ncbi:multidrug transporter [Cryptococcus wingfieldii CBS 7118]|uniref:Multidrug transporter n=1 Tax=Cryptococcus wingfieldii CBS 7118 TaxID=1295528 RepID=A0A1E3IYF8_9TREE|nr:multidrug transporter [Cryptococcus wingfieldii CBS 7118]ODN92741.1 multidrug transporter [Cryptococcus wingfieldii CBS 7118]
MGKSGSTQKAVENRREADLESGQMSSDEGTTLHPSESGSGHKRGKIDDKGREIIDWDGPDDPDNPFNFSISYKWLLTITTCFISILTGLPAGAYGAGNEYMEEAYGIDQTNFPWLQWATCSWNIGAATFPLLFVPLTEKSGRMPGYFISYIVFLIFLIPSGVGTNFATMIVTRFFGGGASSVSINIVGGTIADIWKGPKERSIPMSIFGMTSVVGIALGPFIGGAIQTNHSTLNWHWIYWMQLIFDGALLPVFWFILRETRGDVILAKRAAKIRKETGREVYAKSELKRKPLLEELKISFERPTKMLVTEFVVAAFTLWVSFAWGLLFLFQNSITQTFQTNYGFNTFQTSLIQLALSVGAVVGTIINPFQDRMYLGSAARNKETKEKPIPEARLYFSMPGSLLFTGALFWYGWTSYPSIHWIVPTLAIGFIGLGIYSIYMGTVTYLTDAYEKYASSALSAASLGRNAFGAFLPLASQALFTNLGFHWAGSLLGFLALALSGVPFLLFYKGEYLRHHSPFIKDAMFDSPEQEEEEKHPADIANIQTVEGANRYTAPAS